MRISDWSSDVCSSDLDVMVALRHRRPVAHCGHRLFANAERHLRTIADLQSLHPPELLAETLRVAERCVFRIEQVKYEYPKEVVGEGHTRSEEHTSELQSLMRISYAVFCMQKKK